MVPAAASDLLLGQVEVDDGEYYIRIERRVCWTASPTLFNDSMHLTPAFVVDSRLDLLAANKLGEALYAPIYADPVVHRTKRGSCSSTRTRATSGATGPPTPRTRSHCCAPRLAETPTTAA
jgi:hypothetical protein